MADTPFFSIKETSIIKELIKKLCTIEQLDYLLQLDKTPCLEAHALEKRIKLLNEELNKIERSKKKTC